MTSRRLFLKSGAAAMLSLGFAPSFLARAVAATDARRRLLITIFQRGAVDGLNMVVPYAESEYYRLRPSIAVSRPGADGGALDLNSFFGLHPQLAPLMPLWTNRSLAIVHACGSPDHTRSHFDAQDFMESATPGVKATHDGWLNRYLGATNPAGSPLRGVAIARQMPRTLQGPAPALAFGGVEEFVVRGATRSPFQAAYARTGDKLLASTGTEAFEAMETLERATAGGYRPAPGAEYPNSPFGRALQEIARVAKADVGLEVAFTESGNWDHHVNEEGRLPSGLDDLARGIAALTVDLGERMSDTVIMTMSEFGRAVAENGTRGTDHGHGNVMFIAGGPVRGGAVYGRWPGLSPDDRFEGRDLAVTTDFRDVFSEVVAGHLGAPADALARVFPGFTRSKALGLV
jgi:uncharacterized protein (DUF1501 family)